MSDESIPPKTPKNGDGDNRANDGSSQNTDQNGENEETSSKSENWIAILETVAGLIFVGLAVAFDFAGYHFLSFLCIFFSVVCAIAIITHYLKKLGWKYSRSSFIFLVLLSVALFAFLYLHQRSLENPSPEPLPEPNIVEWQPPKLPDGIKNAFLNFGGNVWTIDVDKLKAGQPFIPPEMGTNPITIYLKDNRLYVHSDSGPNGLDITTTPDFMDNFLKQGWDRNFTNNVFEIIKMVQSRPVPTLQVIYERPNEITVNGIFLVKNKVPPIPSTNPLNEIFQGKPILILAVFGTNYITCGVNPDEVETGILPFTNNVLFEYPAWKFPGIFANDSGSGPKKGSNRQ